MPKKPTFSWLEIAAGLVLLLIIIAVSSAGKNTGTPETRDTTVSTVAELGEENQYLESVRKGAEWFLNNQDENFIYYEYSLKNRKHSKSHHSLREMGGLWSITQLANYLNDEDLYKLGERGFAHFEKHFEFDRENDFMYVNITPEKVKLGYNAFAILTLLDIDHPEKDFYLQELADGILYHQQEDGSLQTFFFSKRSTGVDYYPGEALLALMSLYEETGNEDYLETAKKAFPFYVDYWNGNPNTAFIPWQSRANYKLFKATGDKEVADFILKMNDFMLDQHNPEETCGKFVFHRGITTAVFLEGVVQAYKAAKDVGDEQRTECYANFIREGVDFIMTIQIMDEDKYEQAAVGGFLGSENSSTMRVDRNQHATMAIMDALNEGLLN